MSRRLKLAGKCLGVLVALAVSALWGMIAMRMAGVGLFAVLLLSVMLLPLHKRRRLVLAVWVLYLLATVLPIDIRFDSEPGLQPRILRIQWGLPSQQGAALIEEGKRWPGGCVVSGFDPTWALVL